jgi:2-polyprenyl-3-methyl-5-hydroxy-6-metoxy-1,4-benzoquinol methylase
MDIDCSPTTLPGEHEHRLRLLEFQRANSRQLASSRRRNLYLHRTINGLINRIVTPNSSVLDVGCGDGLLLGRLSPQRGVGVDINPDLIRQAAEMYPQMTFHPCAIEDYRPGEGETFDYIILSGVLQQIYDIHGVLRKLRYLCHARTRIIICTYSRVWQPAIRIAELLGIKCPVPEESWIPPSELENLLHQGDFEIVRKQPAILLPAGIPVISNLINRWAAPLPLLRHGCLVTISIARPLGLHRRSSGTSVGIASPVEAPAPSASVTSAKSDGSTDDRSSISIIVPLRNEAGNVASLLARIPKMADRQEVIFVEGNSTDNTWDVLNEVVAGYRGDMRLAVYKQTGKGKRDAVRLGFAQSSGDVLAILDGDISVPPEELPRFFDLIFSGKAEFANGSRLVYPMESEAMQFLNMIANKCFGYAFSYLLGQSIRDTLCGTKVLRRDEYDRIAANRSYFGDFDPFGDFDLLFGAARLNLKILDVPVHYKQRVYGTTNISRFRHGLMLIRMCFFAARKICFVSS